MMKVFFSICILFCFSASAQEFAKAIEDNSYFIEEAYNQEEGIVQHIVNGAAFSPGTTLETSFTQEWPVDGQTHQLSYTIPFVSMTGTTPARQGIGDLMINYRYQLANENGFAVSPRATVILPTGDEGKGLGNGVTGFQVNLPVSMRLSHSFITHYNAGATVLPDVRFAAARETVTEFFAGASIIHLTQSHFNIMAEVLYLSSGSPFGRTDEWIFSPGARWAIDIGSLQIVPGIAFPVSKRGSVYDEGVLLYASFEHSY